MTPRFFIDRPVFSWVLALTIILGGVLALRALPVEQYPSIAPPTLTVSANYPGADASVLATNVTQVMEQQLNGTEGLLYMSSASRSNGTSSITVTFRPGTDIDVALMDVQSRLRSVEPRLPEEVRRQGVTVQKAGEGFLMIIALTSKAGTTPTIELGNFSETTIVDELRRVPGVGSINSFSSPYAMRIWLDPDKLAGYRLSPADALAAVQEQNTQSSGGSLGDQPLAEGSELNATILTQNRFQTPEQFEAIILRANPDGSVIRLADVARVELGAQSYNFSLELNGKPAAGMAVQLTPGANALAVAQAVKDRMGELEVTFPSDIGWTVAYDTTPFINASVTSVIATLIEAMLLVFLVMFLFLQNWRATLIPTIVVPIALAGACLGLLVFGFSINVLTLFAMVMAIGILVDDAIVVIENVERLMAEEHLSPYDATVKAMTQITSAIVGITLVLVAVFVPMAFFPGSTGGIYRQFSVTLAVSIAFSALMALTLTPALCATLLKPHGRGVAPANRVQAFSQRFFGGFNRWFARTTDRYQRSVGGILQRPLRWLAVFGVLVALTGLLFVRLPKSFLPTEDQGSIITAVQAPSGATTQRTNVAIEQVKDFYAAQPQVERVIFIRGFSFFGQGQAHAMSFASLYPWDERKGSENSAGALVDRANGALAGVKEAMVFVLNPPAIQGLGVASGFTFKLQDRAGLGDSALVAARNQLLGMASQSPLMVGVRPEAQADAPQLRVNIDRVGARALGLAIRDVNSTLSIAFGNAYANDFSRAGRILRVLISADAPFRMTPEDVLELQVRNAQGQMVPFGAFTTVEWTAGTPQLDRYNGYPAMTISGMAAPGRSTGEALNEMERLAAQLPAGFGYEWTGLSFEEKQAGSQVGLLLALSLVVVFLLLAALYESWTVPVAVLLVVPLGVLGSVVFSMLRGLSADVYFNVGIITIIGLAAKNAILIVEFAIEEERQGYSTFEATMNAVKLRLRPIIMTTLAFILGMVPLVRATGAGAASRIAVGTGVAGGMLAATLLGIFFIPLFYLAVRRWLARGRLPAGAVSAPVLLLTLVLGGCSFAPRHVPPALPTPESYPATAVADSATGTSASLIGWRDFFEDERLEALVGAALTHNRDLAVAVARIDEAAGLYRIQRAPRVPSVNAGGSVTRGKSAFTGPDEVTQYSASVAVSGFELDFWGRVRNLSEAARREFLATVEGQRAFRLSLIRQVASTYLLSLEAAERVQLAEATVASRREGVRIAQVRFDAGITSALDLRQASSLLAQAETELAGVRLTRARSENALAVLIGGPVPGELPAPLPLERQASTAALGAGLPSELLVSRPDIIAAENRLRAARANIGAARAAFLPSISLTGLFGYASTELDGLFSGDNETWSFGPSINLPIFTGGRLRGNLTVARAREDITLATYERTIQGAFQEVADALAGRRFLAEQVAAQERGTAAQRQIAALARVRYNEGVVGYIEVLDAERNLFASEQALLQLRRIEADNLIALYIALGGGVLEVPRP